MSCTSSEQPWCAPDGSLVALVDCDTFYASCERVCRPDLRGRPVVVLSNNDGCLVAMSREAKALGLPMGEPEFRVRHLLARHNVAVFSSNYALYGDLSRRVMQTLASVVPHVEVYSIDEAFLVLDSALSANAGDIAREVRQRVARWVGLPVSVGIAPTRVLAKMAIRVAKTYPAYGGIFDLSRSHHVGKLLDSVGVGDVWGVGRKGALKLRTQGIHTARQLRDADPETVRRLLTVRGLNIHMELRGVPAIGEDIPATHVIIISSRSLGRTVRELGALEQAVAFHAARAAEKLRGKRLTARMVSVRLQMRIDADDLSRREQVTATRLSRPTADSAVIIRAAREGLHRIFRTDCNYAKVMVALTELSDPARAQHDMLEQAAGLPARDARRMRLMRLMDRINRVDGRGTLTFAAQGPPHADWHMKRGRLSPCWTTNVHELLNVSGVPGTWRPLPGEQARSGNGKNGGGSNGASSVDAGRGA